MLTRYQNGSLTWIDLFNPTQDEVREAMESCNIAPELMGDLTSPVPRSKVKLLSGAIKLTLDFPIVKRTDIKHPHEIKFIVTKKHMITARYEDVTAVHKFAKEFEVLSLLSRTGKQAHAEVGS